MSRQLRIEFPGAVYHVTSRGNARLPIYENNPDRNRFLQVLAEAVSSHNWICHAYCLMDNHYHLLLETPDGNLSIGMRHLNGVYTQSFNRKHGRVGHLFQGRFKALLVDRDSYLLELCRYVVLNPVRAGMVKRPADYQWSSYRATAGLVQAADFLSTGWVLSQFGKQRAATRRKYAAFVEDGIDRPGPWGEVRNQILLGGERFVREMAEKLGNSRDLKEVPRAQRFADRPSLAELFDKLDTLSREERNQLVCLTHREHGYTLTEIGNAIGLHYSSISKIIARDLH